jgi:hypothetical protein
MLFFVHSNTHYLKIVIHTFKFNILSIVTLS